MQGTHRYFKMRRLFPDGRVQHVVVWDGIKDWKNQPPLKNLRLVGELAADTAGLIKVDRHEKFVDVLMDEDAVKLGDLVFWTNNRKTYKEIVKWEKAVRAELNHPHWAMMQ